MATKKVVSLKNLQDFYNNLKNKFAPINPKNGSEYLTTENGYTKEEVTEKITSISNRLDNLSPISGRNYLTSKTGTEGYTKTEVDNSFMPIYPSNQYIIIDKTDENDTNLTVMGYSKDEIDEKFMAKVNTGGKYLYTNSDDPNPIVEGYTKQEVDKIINTKLVINDAMMAEVEDPSIENLDFNDVLYYYSIDGGQNYTLLDPNDVDRFQTVYKDNFKVYTNSILSSGLTFGAVKNYIGYTITERIRDGLVQNKYRPLNEDSFQGKDFPPYLKYCTVTQIENNKIQVSELTSTEAQEQVSNGNVYVYDDGIFDSLIIAKMVSTDILTEYENTQLDAKIEAKIKELVAESALK